MIRVQVRTSQHLVKMLKVTGHANSAPYGKDLVCAAVSAIMTGGCNMLTGYLARCHNKDGHSEIQVDDMMDEHIQTIIQTLITQLKTVQASANHYMNIQEMED
jgi:uncharacterized protein YsxB (DUF464 family)